MFSPGTSVAVAGLHLYVFLSPNLNFHACRSKLLNVTLNHCTTESILYCTIIYCTINCTVLYYTILYYTIVYYKLYYTESIIWQMSWGSNLTRAVLTSLYKTSYNTYSDIFFCY